MQNARREHKQDNAAKAHGELQLKAAHLAVFYSNQVERCGYEKTKGPREIGGSWYMGTDLQTLARVPTAPAPLGPLKACKASYEAVDLPASSRTAAASEIAR